MSKENPKISYGINSVGQLIDAWKPIGDEVEVEITKPINAQPYGFNNELSSFVEDEGDK